MTLANLTRDDNAKHALFARAKTAGVDVDANSTGGSNSGEGEGSSGEED